MEFYEELSHFAASEGFLYDNSHYPMIKELIEATTSYIY